MNFYIRVLIALIMIALMDTFIAVEVVSSGLPLISLLILSGLIGGFWGVFSWNFCKPKGIFDKFWNK